MSDEINYFRGQYRWLSNFVSGPVTYDGEVYDHVENAYQAAKVREDFKPFRARFKGIPSAAAKQLGKNVQLRPDWDEVKLGIMEDLVRQKFQDPILRQQLLETGDAHIREGNTWGDRFWGCVPKMDAPWVGENHLGKILMEVRRQIREKELQTRINALDA